MAIARLGGMTDCPAEPLLFSDLGPRKVMADFSGGLLSSEGGVLLLRQVDRGLGAHGQMDEGTLERVVIDFWEGEFDVLVCTTIIESGIDMPTVNTLVVDRADLLGLGQLHQLRGRVRTGRVACLCLLVLPARSVAERRGLRAPANHR